MPDTYLKPYSYVEHGRRPLTVLAALFSLGMLALGLAHGAPWYWLLIVGAAATALLWLVVANPASGTRLTADTWSFHGAGFNRSIPVSRIAQVRFRGASDGPDDVIIHLTDGTTLEPPSRCLPSAEVLRAELARARIPLRD